MAVRKIMRNFVPMNNEETRQTIACDNMIIIDADFADRVAFDLIVNFERIIGRKIPNADFARWIDCLALDGGITQGNDHTQVVLVHSKEKTELEYFTPGKFKEELDGKAFSDNLGEFAINTVSEERIVSRNQLMADTLSLATAAGEVKRVIVVADDDDLGNLRGILRAANDNQRITVMAMQPVHGNFRQEILGYSLMSALGIRSDEIPRE